LSANQGAVTEAVSAWAASVHFLFQFKIEYLFQPWERCARSPYTLFMVGKSTLKNSSSAGHTQRLAGKSLIMPVTTAPMSQEIEARGTLKKYI